MGESLHSVGGVGYLEAGGQAAEECRVSGWPELHKTGMQTGDLGDVEGERGHFLGTVEGD